MRLLQISFLIATGCFSVFSQSNAWNDLVPLRSTRADAAKRLGVPKENRNGASTYETKDATVRVGYSTKKCDDGWDVPLHTVLWISVSQVSTRGKSFDELKLDESRYSVSVSDTLSETWTNAEDGVQYDFDYFASIDRQLRSVAYLPKKFDNDRRCDGFAPYEPEGWHQPGWEEPFYNNKLSKEENFKEVVRHFQNFLIQAYSYGKDYGKDKYKAYAVVYFDNKLPFRDYESFFARVKQHLSTTSEAAMKDLTIIEGGLREESRIEFHLLPKEWKPPAPNPTLPSPQFMKRQ